MILGGGTNQLPLVKAAKEMGCTVIICDYAQNFPAKPYADKQYSASILDYEAVLSAAKDAKIDGIISNSEPAMKIVARVAEELKLPTNPSWAIETLCTKHRFRTFLAKKSFACPRFVTIFEEDSSEDVIEKVNTIKFPAMVKPVDSSGSRGVEKVADKEACIASLSAAMSYSRSKTVIIEEFINNALSSIVGGDIFVYKSKVIMAGLMTALRDEKVNPLVPCGEVYPAKITETQRIQIISELNRLFSETGISAGAFNVEIMIDYEGRVNFIEINPRNGGNLIPDTIKLNLGFDIFDATVRAALGEEIENERHKEAYFFSYVVHTKESGVLKNVWFSPEIKPFLQRYYPTKQEGENVEVFSNAEKLIGIAFLAFPDIESRDRTIQEIDKHIKVFLK